MKAHLLTQDYSTALNAQAETPCLSLYQPTHRHHPGNQQDPLRFRHLVNGATGRIQKDDLRDPKLDDLLDDLGELVTSKGGKVVVVPSEQMPTKTGAAATCRF